MMTVAPDQEKSADFVSIAAEIVSAYVSNNPLPRGELPKLIGDVHAALRRVGLSATEPQIKMEPAVPIKKSVTPDYIICLEDGKKLKYLKRHIRVLYNLSPDEYRRKWNLPSDYPMVAPNHAAARSELSKAFGLGRKAAPEPVVAEKPKRTVRAAKARSIETAAKPAGKAARKARAKA